MRKPTLPVLLFLLAAAIPGRAQNPIVLPGVYIADPTARVWEDGRVYVYGSRDEDPGYYCSHRYHALSSSDLKSWTLHEDVFASKGLGDEVPYSDEILYAPDAMYRDGKYYLYYCLASSTDTEGVAVSDSPTGPFKDGRVIDVRGQNQIDPAVFLDDDGQAYYLWGQFSAKMAKLKPNMTEIDHSTVVDGVVTEEEHFFHEGAFLAKRDGIYYLVYAHMGRASRPTAIGYATSRSAMGPYEYGGVIVDNDHSDPGVWNNHGSIADVNGQWYVFYHRSTHASKMMRKVCVEPITFAPDGAIPEVEMTTQGAAGPLPARAKMDAERACLLHGNVRIEAIAADNEQLGGVRNGDAAAYKYLDFSGDEKTFTARVAAGATATRIEAKLASPWGPTIAAVDVPGDGDGQKWTTVTGQVDSREGVHAIWLRFSAGEEEGLARLDWFAFE